MALPANSIVTINTAVASSGVVRREFGRGLLVTTDDALAAAGAGRVQVYADLASFRADFGSTGDAYTEAAAWFGQNPFPRNLVVVRWRNTDVDTVLRGGAATTTVATYTAISDGSFRLGAEDFDGLDLSGVTQTLAAIATALQTEIRTGTTAGYDTAVVTWNATASRWEVAFPDIDSGDAFFAVAHSTGTGTDVSSLFDLREADGATFSLGGDAEDVSDALDAAVEAQDFYFIGADNGIRSADDLEDISAWAGGGSYLASLESNDAAALITAETASAAATVSAAGRGRTVITYSGRAQGAGTSIAARFSSINFGGLNTVITGKFKRLPGVTADDLTTTQVAELRRKRVNQYVTVGGVPIYQEGVTTAAGGWIDTRVWLDWFTDAVRVAIYDLLVATPTRIPQTSRGLAALRSTVDAVCQEGVRNGGIAPGTVSAGLRQSIIAATGDGDFDGFLSAGYLIATGSFADQSQADRADRQAPPVNVFLKGSGAIHFVEADLTFED